MPADPVYKRSTQDNLLFGWRTSKKPANSFKRPITLPFKLELVKDKFYREDGDSTV
jgi:hypothetical protein